MSVFIKGMKMPKSCATCRFTTSSEYCSCLLTGKFNYHEYWNSEKLDECPLVEIKMPHGRLIDADALNLDYEVEMADHWKTAHEIENCVKYAPTVIEAEDE